MFRGRQSIARRPARNEQELMAPRPGDLRSAQPPALPWRQLLFSTLPGRLLILAVSAKILVAIAGAVTILPGFLNALDSAATLALLISVAYFLVKITVRVQRRLLWRVRRKLILSYIFIGVVPALLIVGFGLIGASLLSMNVGAYLFKDGYDDVVRNAGLIADSAVGDISRAPANARESIERLRTNPGTTPSLRQIATSSLRTVAMMKRRPGHERSTRLRAENGATSGISGNDGTDCRRRAADGSTGSRGLPMRRISNDS